MKMFDLVKRIFLPLFRRAGLDVVIFDRFPAELSERDRDVVRQVTPYTMTARDRVSALVLATRYVAQASIPGAVVECGVWKGGSMMAIALTLLNLEGADRELFLYDTFEGMPRPGELDVSFRGQRARRKFERRRRGEDGSTWCRADVAEVRRALEGTGYDPAKLHLIQGKVEETIPRHAPESIALLRLDTDWYESTRHELRHLYPRLVPGGVLIVDDYGHWQGARKATDEYLEENGIRLLLTPVDFSCRVAVKV